MASTPKWLLLGRALEAAVERLERVRPGDAERSFAAVGEALWWAVALDGYLTVWQGFPDYKERRGNDQGGQLLEGIRYARNAIGHHVAVVELLEVCDVYTDTYSDFYGEWCWRAVPSKAQGREIYQERMQGKPARATLRALMPFFSSISTEIEARSNGS